MYPVSNAFLDAVKANNRKYYWTGRITTTAGTVYEFDQDDMVKPVLWIYGDRTGNGVCCGDGDFAFLRDQQVHAGRCEGRAVLSLADSRRFL